LALAVSAPDRDVQYTALVAELKKDAGGDYRQLLTYCLASYAPKLAEKVWRQDQNTSSRDQDIEDALSQLAAVDPARARAWLETMEHDDNAQNGAITSRPASLLSVIRALGKTDPAAALALAAAAESQPQDAALALYRGAAAALQQVNSSTDAINLAQLAASAAHADPQEARRLLALALQYMQAGKHANDGMRDDMRLRALCRFAYFAGQADPLEARLLLESAYREGKGQTGNNGELQEIPVAVATIDLTRGMELFADLFPKSTDQQQALFSGYMQHLLYHYIACTKEERQADEDLMF
jgi:hypothetical protein